VDLWQDRMIAAFGFGLELEARDVDQRFVERPGAVLVGRNVVNVDGCQANVFPAAAVIKKETNVLGRSRTAEITAIAKRQLYGDGGFQKILDWIVPYAGQVFVGRVADDFLYWFENLVAEIAKIVRVLSNQARKLSSFLLNGLGRCLSRFFCHERFLLIEFSVVMVLTRVVAGAKRY